MTAGRPRTPREVKRRRGTLKPSRDGGAAITVIPGVEVAPEAEPAKTGTEFIQLALDSGARVWIGSTDLPAVEIARQLWEDRELAREEYRAHRDKDSAQSYVRITEKLIQCLSALGLDPTARARLGIAEVKRQSTLDRLEGKRAERKAGRRAG